MSGSIFDGIENAKVSNDGNWVRPGKYTATIVGVKMVKKFNGDQFVAIELKIASVLDDENGTGHKVGEDVTHLLKVANPSFLGNFKQFASTALGCEAEDLGKAEADRITSDEQPLAGIEIALTARQIKTQKGNPFTKVMYSDADATE
jgi:hypothetical protein